MKKLILMVATIGMLTGCTHFNPAQLHEAYQKTKDSYAFVKDAYKQIKDDYAVITEDAKAVVRETADAFGEAKDELKKFTEYDNLSDWANDHPNQVQ